MICPFCGKDNAITSQKCERCGVSFAREPLVADILPPRRRHLSPFIIALSTIGVFGIIILLIIFLNL